MVKNPSKSKDNEGEKLLSTLIIYIEKPCQLRCITKKKLVNKLERLIKEDDKKNAKKLLKELVKSCEEENTKKGNLHHHIR